MVKRRKCPPKFWLQHQPHYAHTTSTNAGATATSPATTTPRLLLPSRLFPFFLCFFVFFFFFLSWTLALLVVVVDCCRWSGAEVCPLDYTTFLGMTLRQHRAGRRFSLTPYLFAGIDWADPRAQFMRTLEVQDCVPR